MIPLQDVPVMVLRAVIYDHINFKHGFPLSHHHCFGSHSLQLFFANVCVCRGFYSLSGAKIGVKLLRGDSSPSDWLASLLLRPSHCQRYFLASECFSKNTKWRCAVPLERFFQTIKSWKPLDLQGKLLTVLKEKTSIRLGNFQKGTKSDQLSSYFAERKKLATIILDM